MIKKIKNFICNLFGIKQCACPEKDEHLQLYEDMPEPETPIYIEKDGKLKHCSGHLILQPKYLLFGCSKKSTYGFLLDSCETFHINTNVVA